MGSEWGQGVHIQTSEPEEYSGSIKCTCFLLFYRLKQIQKVTLAEACCMILLLLHKWWSFRAINVCALYWVIPENSLRYFNGPPHHVTFQTQLHGNHLHVKTDVLPSSHVCLMWTLSKVRKQRKNHSSFIWKHPWEKIVRLASSRQSKITHMFLKHLKTLEFRKIYLEFVMKTFFLSLSYLVNDVIFPRLLVKNFP